MPLTPLQRRRVAWLKDGYLDDDDSDTPDFQARWDRQFAAISSPEELFLHASGMHPASQPHEWQVILDHPLCDAGTALLIFWRNSPVYHYGEEPAGGWDRQGHELVFEIARMYAAGEYPSAMVRFDPAAFKGINFLRGHKAEELARVPEVMHRPSSGEPVSPLTEADYDWCEDGF